MIFLILFTNDSHPFCKASSEQLLYLGWVFLCFKVVSILKLNIEKCKLIPIMVLEEVEQLALSFSCSVGVSSPQNIYVCETFWDVV